MATDEAFVAASCPDGHTVSRKQDSANQPGTCTSDDVDSDDVSGGSIGGSISTISGAIRRTAEATASAISSGESPVFIVQDSTGGY